MDTPRKASDVLLSMESTLNTLVGIIQAQDLNIKVLSNKLNNLMQAMEKQATAAPKVTVETVNSFPASPFQQMQTLDPERQIPISSESKLPVETSPKGFRRTSRPETFEGDNAYLSETKSVQPKFPMQMPKPPPGREVEAMVPPNKPVIPPSKAEAPPLPIPEATSAPAPKGRQTAPQNAIPVQQRIVDRGGKSVFLADVEIVAHETGETVSKTRTNGTGKWQAVLGIGSYRVTIRKRESLTKEKVEAVQDVHVDGSQSPLELQVMIIK